MKDNKVNLFIVGAAKAGTSSLNYYLEQHPKVFMSPIKEPNYFGSDIDWNKFRDSYKKTTSFNYNKYFSNEILEKQHNAFISNRKHYNALFREVKNQSIIGESSTSYLYSQNAAKEIFDYNPKAKIIIILRNPIERTISHYKMDFAGGSQKENSFIKGIKSDYLSKNKGYGISNLYIELSLYYEQILRYKKLFNSDQLLILDFNELTQNVDNVLKKTFSFLNISSSIEIQSDGQNITQMRKSTITKMRFLKRFLPGFLIRFIKSNQSLLYKKEIPLNIEQNEIEYLKTIIIDDWNKTLRLIKPT